MKWPNSSRKLVASLVSHQVLQWGTNIDWLPFKWEFRRHLQGQLYLQVDDTKKKKRLQTLPWEVVNTSHAWNLCGYGIVNRMPVIPGSFPFLKKFDKCLTSAHYLIDAFQVSGDPRKSHMWVRLSVWLITTLPEYCLGSCAQSSADQLGISRPDSYVDSLPGALRWQVLQQLEGRMVIVNDKMRVERGWKMPSL